MAKKTILKLWDVLLEGGMLEDCISFTELQYTNDFFFETTLSDALAMKWSNDTTFVLQRVLVLLSTLQRKNLILRSSSSQYLVLKFSIIGQSSSVSNR